MKLRILALLMLCAVFVMASCREGSAPGDIELPGTLKVTAELPEDYPDEAASYDLSWYEADEGAAAGAFMRDPGSAERLEYAMGPQLRNESGEVSEYLNIHSGVLHGGLDYSYHTAREADTYTLRRLHPWDNVNFDLTPRKYGNDEMAEGPAEDLGFMSYAEAMADVEARMSAAGFPEHQLLLGEAYSAGALNGNRDIYNQAAERWGTEPVSACGEDNEFYYFQFRPVLDGIPFCNVFWPRQNSGEGGATGISAAYTKDGLVEFRAYNLCEPGEAVSTEAIIPPEEALAAYVEEYSKAIHFRNTDVISVELNYLKLFDSKGMYARPAWVITTATEVKAGDAENLEFDYTEYEVTAVSAYSGVILERETDMR